MFACLAFGKCSNWIQLVGCTSSRLNLPSPQLGEGLAGSPKGCSDVRRNPHKCRPERVLSLPPLIPCQGLRWN